MQIISSLDCFMLIDAMRSAHMLASLNTWATFKLPACSSIACISWCKWWQLIRVWFVIIASTTSLESDSTNEFCQTHVSAEFNALQHSSKLSCYGAFFRDFPREASCPFSFHTPQSTSAASYPIRGECTIHSVHIILMAVATMRPG